jgi:hypothetical protein
LSSSSETTAFELPPAIEDIVHKCFTLGIKLATIPEKRKKLTAQECKSAEEENVEKNNKSYHGTNGKPVPPLTTKVAFKFQNSLPYCWCINVRISIGLQLNAILVQDISTT